MFAQSMFCVYAILAANHRKFGKAWADSYRARLCAAYFDIRIVPAVVTILNWLKTFIPRTAIVVCGIIVTVTLLSTKFPNLISAALAMHVSTVPLAVTVLFGLHPDIPKVLATSLLNATVEAPVSISKVSACPFILPFTK